MTFVRRKQRVKVKSTRSRSQDQTSSSLINMAKEDESMTHPGVIESLESITSGTWENNEDDNFFGIPSDFKLEKVKLDLTSEAAYAIERKKAAAFYDDFSTRYILHVDKIDPKYLKQYDDEQTIYPSSNTSERNKNNTNTVDETVCTSPGNITASESLSPSMQSSKPVQKSCSDFVSIDDQYFGDMKSSSVTSGSPKLKDTELSIKGESSSLKESDFNAFDKEYFGDSLLTFKQKPSGISEPSGASQSSRIDEEKSQWNTFDQQYFTEGLSKPSISSQSNAEVTDKALKNTSVKSDGSNFMSVVENYDFANKGTTDLSGISLNNTIEKSYSYIEADINEIDKQFFGDVPFEDRSIVSESKRNLSIPNKGIQNQNVDQSDFNTIEEQFFKQRISSLSNEQSEKNYPDVEETENYLKSQEESSKVGYEIDTSEMDPSRNYSIKEYLQQRHALTNILPRLTSPRNSLQSDDKIDSSVKFLKEKLKKGAKKQQVVNTDGDTNTAYNLAMRIRKDLDSQETNEKSQPEKEDLEGYYQDKNRDSKGFKLTLKQAPEWDKMTSKDVARMLKQRIIYNNDDFLAIDKPYGLPSIGQKGDRLSVSGLLPELASRLPPSYKTDELHVVQGLDREVSGTVILAKSPETAAILRGLLNSDGEVIQRFWAITKGVPSLNHGIIDIPIGEAKVGNIYKMVLRPQFTREQKSFGLKKSRRPAFRAVTEYEVMASHLQCSLLECTPHTNNLKHQMRVHLASGLNTPILGDHKFSHYDKQAPQKLHKDMLDALKIRQAKVRQLGLFLHCRSVILRDWKGKMVFLTTRPPLYFKNALEKLSLNIDKKHMRAIR